MKVLAVLSALYATASGAVIEATDADFETYLGSGVPAIVDLWAPWCSHCRSFSPKFDELAALYDHLPDKIQFIKIDGEANRQASKKFDLEYFPTIKFVAGDEQEEIHDRSIKNIKKVIKSKLHVTPEDPPSEPSEPSEPSDPAEAAKADEPAAGEPKLSRADVESYVVQLHDENFEDAVDGKHALVAFTTTWCHYCKDLQPEWKQAAKLYAEDDDIIFVNVDCTDPQSASALMQTFHVEGYPTIVYFPADGSVPKPYAGPRSVDGFTEYFKRLGVSAREPSGLLGSGAGLILDIDVSDLAKAEKQLKNSDSPFKEKYLRVIKKASADPQYIDRELKRIGGILESHQSGASLIQAAAVDDLQIRLNILRSFASGGSSAEAGDSDVKDEL